MSTEDLVLYRLDRLENDLSEVKADIRRLNDKIVTKFNINIRMGGALIICLLILIFQPFVSGRNKESE